MGGLYDCLTQTGTRGFSSLAEERSRHGAPPKPEDLNRTRDGARHVNGDDPRTHSICAPSAHPTSHETKEAEVGRREKENANPKPKPWPHADHSVVHSGAKKSTS